MAEPRPGAGAVNFRARDGFTESLPLSVVMGTPEIMVVHRIDGDPLPDGHGFPARMIIPGRYGMKGPKWLEEIDVAVSQLGGFWEGQGWDTQAIIKKTSRIHTPAFGSVVHSGTGPGAGAAVP